ncbi:MAG: hypothetical protein GC153_03215 [Alphaproteobacteria bacterium]|nr:hypothetical protein [Alphaproteobacteria bacterium]
MTGNTFLDLLISLGGIAIMVAVSWGLGAWRTAKVDAQSARERLAFDEPDFRAVEMFVSADGRTAAALSEGGGEVAFVFAAGTGLGTRRAKRGAAELSAEGCDVVARLGDITAPRLRLKAPDEATAARWAGRLSGATYN